jgi:hypothetical protein
MPPVHLSGASPPLTQKEWEEKYRFFSNLPSDNRRCVEQCRFFDKMKGDIAGPIATGETSRFMVMNRSRKARAKVSEHDEAEGVHGPMDLWTPEDRKKYSYNSVFSRLEGYLIQSNEIRDQRMAVWRRSMAIGSKNFPQMDSGVQAGMQQSMSTPAL